MFLQVRRFAILGLLAVVAGCGGGPELHPVSGKVIVNGEPLANATIIFQPIGEDVSGVSSGGMTDANGEFQLKANDGRMGAVAGKHQVSIVPPKVLAATGREDSPEYFEEIVEGEDPDFEVFEFELTKSDVPGGDLAAARMTPQTEEFEVPPGGTSTANFVIEAR